MHKVLITAGASGIGREIALGFARAGARVAVLDVEAAALGGLDVLVVFLASDAARSISGQALPIDGDLHRSV